MSRNHKITGSTLIASVRRLAISLAAVAGATYLLFGILLYTLQEHLLFLAGPGVSRPDLEAFEISFLAPDGTTLHGWYVTTGDHRPLVIYYGGNGERMAYSVDAMRQLGDFNWLFVDYRGYGRSGGVPGEQVLKSDALFIFDTLTATGSMQPGDTHLMGRSLGTGIALSVAAQREVASVVLITPYDSLAAVAGTHYPFYPTNWLLRHPFRSVDLAPLITAPVLVIQASNDVIIPHQHTKTLFEAFTGPGQYRVIEGTSHNRMYNTAFYSVVSEFLEI